MRNTNWTIIALALCAAAAVFYFMKKSDSGKTQEAATSQVATSMDVENLETGEAWEPEEMVGEPADDDGYAIDDSDEEID